MWSLELRQIADTEGFHAVAEAWRKTLALGSVTGGARLMNVDSVWPCVQSFR